MFNNFIKSVQIICLKHVGLEWVKSQYPDKQIIEKDNTFILDGVNEFFYRWEINELGMGELVKYSDSMKIRN